MRSPSTSVTSATAPWQGRFSQSPYGPTSSSRPSQRSATASTPHQAMQAGGTPLRLSNSLSCWLKSAGQARVGTTAAVLCFQQAGYLSGQNHACAQVLAEEHQADGPAPHWSGWYTDMTRAVGFDRHHPCAAAGMQHHQDTFFPGVMLYGPRMVTGQTCSPLVMTCSRPSLHDSATRFR